MGFGGKMKNFILNYKRVFAVLLILVLFVSLTGCGGSYDEPLNGYGDEGNIFEWILVWPIGWLMSTIGNFFNGSFGIAVIITTILVRIVSYPIYAGTTNTTFKMQLAQPDIQRVQSKYAGRTDENSKRKMNMEIQAVYKKHNFNPLGCLWIVFQFPIFSAMYTVIQRIQVPDGDLTLGNFSFLGADLRGGLFDTTYGVWSQVLTGIFVALLVATMAFSQYLGRKKPSYQKNIPNKNPNQQQEKMMKVITYMSPLMMGFMASQSAGLALYWVIGNTFQLVQTILVRRSQEKKYEKMNNIF